MEGLHVERDSARQEHDDAHKRVNALLSEVETERGLKLKAEGVSTVLAIEDAQDKAKIHTMETEVSRQRGKIDRLRLDVKGESSGPMLFFFLDPRCLFDMVSVMAWADLEDKLAEEAVKS
jgi:hypothetical protein